MTAPALAHAIAPTDPTHAPGGRVLRVRRRTEVARDVVALELGPVVGEPLPAWAPGAHIDVSVPADGGPLVRQYSLCGDPGTRDRWRIAVLREPGGRGGSAAMHDDVGEGDLLRVAGPRNHFPLPPDGPCCFVAGGIGITPILPMVRAVAAAGRSWRLLYAARSAERHAFVADLPEGEVTLHADGVDGPPDLDAMLAGCDAGTAVVACGPEGLLSALEARHAPDSPWSLHVERFAPSSEPAVAEAGTFEVVCARSGLTLSVGPDVSILDALHDAGCAPESSCTEGVCGTCETRVLDGEIVHRDVVLTAEERQRGDFMMVCVSRAPAGGRLVLDL